MRTCKEAPIVSVCIITHNQERYIGECIKSVIEQICDLPIEIIIGDDASTDATATIINEFKTQYPKVIKTIFQKSNIDRGHTNFITVHNAAVGKYVAHIDGDDLMSSGKLKKQVDFLENNPNFTVCWHRAKIVDENSKVVSETKSLDLIYPNGIVEIGSLLRYGVSPIHSTIMYRRSARKTLRPDFVTLDLFYSLEYLMSGKGKILYDPLGCYRITAGTLGARTNITVRRLYAHHLNYYLNISVDNKSDIFLNSIINTLRDIFNRRITFVQFGIVALRSMTIIKLSVINEYISNVLKIKSLGVR
jgi:glycosyltransferase involved in cell wall biosynthesis